MKSNVPYGEAIELFRKTLVSLLVLLSSAMVWAQGTTITIAGDADEGENGRWLRAQVEAWAAETGNSVEYVGRPNSTTETLALYQQYWAARSSDIDVYLIDVIWPGLAAPHALDLTPYFTPEERAAFFEPILANNTVGGQLVAAPFFVDIGMLYYRTDLLEKYGYEAPPVTWQELTEVAAAIQEGERAAGKEDFYGFVWQGNAYEGLTCNALEWIYSFGGGTLVESDGAISVNNPKAAAALELAASWVGTISPRGVTTYTEEEARNLFQSGNAAFMRNWPYAYALGESEGSAVAGTFNVTVLPSGEGGSPTATLGGWHLMVSRYSTQAEAAVDLVKYLTSSEVQRDNALILSRLPTQTELYNDPAVLEANPWYPALLPALENAAARPSTVTGSDYNQVSTAFYRTVHEILNGQTPVEQGLDGLENTLRRVVR